MVTSSQNFNQIESDFAEDIHPEMTEIVVLPELLTMLKDQLQSLANTLTDNLSSDHTEPSERLQICISQLEFLGNAAQASGLSGIQGVLEYVQANIELMVDDDKPLSVIEAAMVSAVFDLLQTYLDKIDEPAASSNLVKHLQKIQWREPVPDEEAIELIQLLGSVMVAIVPVAADGDLVAVTAEDVSIALSSEVNTELLESLLEELPDLIGNFSDAITRIIEVQDTEAVREAQRIAHTLKGSGNMVGIVGIANLTHDLEDIFEAMAEQGLMPTADLAITLESASDCLEIMGDALLGLGEAPPQALEVLQNVRNWNREISISTSNQADTSLSAQIPDDIQEPASVEKPKQSPVGIEGSSSDPVGVSEDKGSTIRVPASKLDHLLRIAGEGNLLTTKLHEHLKFAKNQIELAVTQNKKLQCLIEQLNPLLKIPVTSTSSAHSLTPSGFDSLEMDQFSELQSHTNQLAELATDLLEIHIGFDTRLVEMNELVSEQDKVQKDSQEWALNIRLLSIQTIVSRCQRVIRQACKMTDKQVQLHITGENLQVDGKILDQLIDPLMHILRNSVDHGIESGDLRAVAGKPRMGNIYLSFSRNGRYLNIVCKDDGGGLDYGEIRRKAENKGLLNWSQGVTDEELTQMILIPGFSTRDTVSQTSGRGVGMDVVHTHIETMKGNLTLESRSGEGLTIKVQVPMPLLSTPCLLIHSADRMVAVSTQGIEQVVHPDPGQLKQMDSGLEYQWNGSHYRVNQLDEMLGLSAVANFETLSNKLVLIIESHNDEKKVILVDRVEDPRDFVVKPMGAYVPAIKGIVGATILGDGSVTPVVSIPELMDNTLQTKVLFRHPNLDSRSSNSPKALVVDDSLSARRTLSEFLRDMGFEVETALDGLDAISKMTQKIPDVLLTDMEMPRMNGLELTTHVSHRDELKHMPVIMITSRSSTKHQQQAQEAGVQGYLTKPWKEDDLTRQLNHVLEHT